MFLFYLLSFIGLIILLIFAGVKLSELVDHPTFYIFFWFLYIVSILVIANLFINIKATYIIENKEGPPGIVGDIGERGDAGKEAKCEPGCKNKVCHLKIMRKLNQTYNKILSKAQGKEIEPPKIIHNRYIRETVKRICHSKQFKEVSQLQHPFKLLEYISEIFSSWIEQLAKADKSEKKGHLQNYLDTFGEESEWSTLVSPGNNPFLEIQKYDIYYWGLKKEFHPRTIQAPIKPPGWKSRTERKAQGREPRIRAYKTNIYHRTYSDRGTGAEWDGATWMTPPLKINRRTYYPLGSIGTRYHWTGGWNKYISRMGNKNDTTHKLRGSYYGGPSHSNVVVSGSRYWVRKPHPHAWSWHWNDNETGGDTDVTFWNANDFREDGQLYRCFGGMVRLNHSWWNPSYQLGRENVPFVCINDKALDRMPHRHSIIWKDSGSGGEHDGSIWGHYDGTYNLAYFRRGYGPNYSRRFYKIKDEFLNERDNDPEEEQPFTSNREKDYGFGYGHHKRGVKREREKGIFQLLDLVIDSDLESQYHRQKIFLTHSGLNHPNSYLIQEYDQDTFVLSKCLQARDNGQVVTCNTTKPEQIWELEFLEASKELCLVKSKKNGKYLKSIKPWKYQVDGKVPSKNLNDPKLKPYVWKLVPKEGEKEN